MTKPAGVRNATVTVTVEEEAGDRADRATLGVVVGVVVEVLRGV